MDIHHIISSFSYTAIFFLMIANGAINFPSSQFLYVVCGYFIGTGSLLFVPTIIAGALGNTIGNTITYLLIKKYEHPLARKILMMDEATFKQVHGALHETFSRRGLWLLFFGKLVPSVKAFIPVVAGLADTKKKSTILIFLVASFIWAIGVTSIGYFFGEHVTLTSLGSVSLIIAAIMIAIIYKKISTRLAQTKD